MEEGSLIARLSKHGVENLGVWKEELNRTREDKEYYRDILKHGKFALLFVGNEFKVTMYPSGKEGPNLLITKNDFNIYAEVRRIHPDYVQSAELRKAGTVQYGNFDKDTKEVRDIIIEEIRQGGNVPYGDAYLICISSNKESIEEIEFKQAVKYLEQEGYSQISGVLFNNGYLSTKTWKRWHFWNNPNTERKIPPDISKDLESMI